MARADSTLRVQFCCAPDLLRLCGNSQASSVVDVMRAPLPRRRALRPFLGCTLLSAALATGCYSGLQPVPEPQSIPGEAPLRRLTNGEYLNTLHDIFPDQNRSLPALPNDALVGGFHNAAESQAPSDLRISRFETIANLYAQGATSTTEALQLFVGYKDWSTPSLAESCATHVIRAMGGRLFRRPLSAEELDRFKPRFDRWRATVDFEAAVRLMLSTWLQSPPFLYRPEPEALGATPGAVAPVPPYAMASRLSYFLWESTPDDMLLAAAARN